ncbi:MAG: hypothetical protein IIA00_09595 [Proteobacteria bacterium]|nr:hypothetical protein [Pseudomonadota bacterium]
MLRVALAVAALAAFPALAQEAPTCVKRSDLLDHLAANYDESPIAMGLTTSGKVLEIVVSEGGSWTIIVTTPSGISCGIASGESWKDMSPEGEEEPKA